VVVTPGAGWAGPHKPVLACRVTPAPRGQPADGRRAVQAWGTRRRDGGAVADGWRAAGVPPVARASPGDYGPPVDTLRAGSGPGWWGTAAPGPPGPGRQTERAEARWLANRRRQGGRQARVIPPAAPRERRDRTRDRTPLVPERHRAGTRVPGVRERATLQVAVVAADRLGGAGRALLAAVLAG
jgi:hypothetical protein